MKATLTSKLKLAATLFAAATALEACTKGGNVSGSGLSAVSGTLTISQVYPTSEGSTWTAITSSSRYYIKGLKLTVTGTCTRGIATIKVHEGSSAEYSETTTCLDDGTFTWQKTYAATTEEGDKTLTFTPYDVTGAAISGAPTVDVRIDNTAPTTPTITDPGTLTYAYNGSDTAYTIVGSCSTDTAKIVGPAGVVITPSGTSWTYSATLVSGSSLSFGFTAYDLAGNSSPSVTQTITWNPLASLQAGGAIPGTQASDVSGMTAESSVYTFSGQQNDTGSVFGLSTGFNYIINKARGL